jgi:hypothetical protein
MTAFGFNAEITPMLRKVAIGAIPFVSIGYAIDQAGSMGGNEFQQILNVLVQGGGLNAAAVCYLIMQVVQLQRKVDVIDTHLAWLKHIIPQAMPDAPKKGAARVNRD